MQTYLYCVVAVLIAANIQPGHSVSVMTPSVKIKEENPPKGSPRISQKPSGLVEIIALIGQPLSMECIPRDVSETARVNWKWQNPNDPKDSTTINDNMQSTDISKYKITKGTSAKNAIRLELPTVNEKSAGFYICQVLYQEDLWVEDRRLIKVFAYPRIVQYLSSFEISAQSGKNTTLSCAATGVPPPTVYWMRIGGSSSLIRGHGRRYYGGKILFQKTQPEDRGLYRCEAINKIGQTAWNVQLNVRFKPQVVIETPSVDPTVKQKVGCKIQLQCTVTGNPRPKKGNMLWTNGRGEDITESGKRVRTYMMEAADFTTYYLINFETTDAADFGRYTCSASNELGTGSASVQFAASSIAIRDSSDRIMCSGNNPPASAVLLLFGFLLAIMRP